MFTFLQLLCEWCSSCSNSNSTCCFPGLLQHSNIQRNKVSLKEDYKYWSLLGQFTKYLYLIGPVYKILISDWSVYKILISDWSSLQNADLWLVSLQNTDLWLVSLQKTDLWLVRYAHVRTNRNSSSTNEVNLATVLICIVIIFLLCHSPRYLCVNCLQRIIL